MKLNINGNEAIIEGDNDGFAAKLIDGCQGKIKINTPLGKRDLRIVKKFKSKSKSRNRKAKKAKD